MASQRRPYQVVMAATREMGISKNGELPWDLPTDRQFFEDITTITSDSTKRNAVVMGRLTWEAIPISDRPLRGRFNIILTRSSPTSYIKPTENVTTCGSLDSALVMLGQEPYSSLIETVFVTGGGQILRDGLHGDGCEAIHLTEIEASMECDTFMPSVNTTLFYPWNVSFPVVENGVRYSFAAYVRWSRMSSSDDDEFSRLLPGMVYIRHEEVAYLRELKDILATKEERIDSEGNQVWSKFGCQIGFNLRKTFPLMTTKNVPWQGVVEELLRFINGSDTTMQKDGINVPLQENDDHIAGVINKINKNNNNNPNNGGKITLSGWDPAASAAPIHKEIAIVPSFHHVLAHFSVDDGELSCRVYQQEVDMVSDLPFNVASYALLTCFMACVCDLQPGDLIYEIGEAYVRCTDTIQQQLLQKNSPQPFPILKINTEKKDIHSFAPSDFQLTTYYTMH